MNVIAPGGVETHISESMKNIDKEAVKYSVQVYR